jgi:tRNA wybutosine-synthesizing protein 3
MTENFEITTFENMKKNTLTKTDKSKKGFIDEKIKKLIEKINENKNYFTTSSCSGRIVLISKGKKKNECEWLYSTHELADKDELWNLLQNIKTNSEVFFKMESFILHVSCKTLTDAEKFLLIARKLFKRAGIISLKKLSIEIIGSYSIETLIIKDKKILISKEYLDNLTDDANEKLKLNWEKMEEFKKMIYLL